MTEHSLFICRTQQLHKMKDMKITAQN